MSRYTGRSPNITYTITDQLNVLELQRDGLTATLGANGDLGPATNISGYSLSSANRTIIGAENDGNGNFMSGDIAEIVIYDHVLASADRSGVLAHLTDMYLGA